MEDDAARADLFSGLKNELSEVQSGVHRGAMESEARFVIRSLADRERIDLVGDVALPWAVAVLTKMSGASGSCPADMMRIAASLLYEKAFGLHLEEGAKPLWLRNAGPEAKSENPERELELLIERRELAISKVMFFALTQSLTVYLAKSWLALISNSDQMAWLAEEPDRFQRAGTELLRYSGIVRSLFRKATEDVRIGTARIGKGELVELKIAAANFDCQRFLNPAQLDISRSVKLQLSLGAGLHTCPGSSLVRQAFAVVTSALLRAKPKLIPNQRIEWMGDSTLRWPLAVWVSWGRGVGDEASFSHEMQVNNAAQTRECQVAEKTVANEGNDRMNNLASF
ncbi:MAG TPA: hypothetical protein VGI45_17270 [Terracidiphilus sp.]